ncbi:MAG: hypothetical protein U5R06_01595 [candidate division KSB1 bacterium]|nr:hypothetical protein [candidate division KSB1 bacterium]
MAAERRRRLERRRRSGEQGKSDPLKRDSDADGLSDGAEVNQYKTDPAKADTDGDGLATATKVNNIRPISAENRYRWRWCKRWRRSEKQNEPAGFEG